jgi:hypothetical protein
MAPSRAGPRHCGQSCAMAEDAIEMSVATVQESFE